MFESEGKTMAAISDQFLRTQLEERRQRLETAIASSGGRGPVVQLLQEVESALERMEKGSYGICETCHDSIEKERLITDPLVRFCLDHLTSAPVTACRGPPRSPCSTCSVWRAACCKI